jgi:general secretion pathway protein F
MTGSLSFRYRAATGSGRVAAGTLTARTRGEAEAELHRRGLLPLELDEDQGKEPRRRRLKGRTDRFTSERRDVTEAMGTLAALLEAGIPLEEALAVTEQAVVRTRVAQAVGDLRRSVQEGRGIAEEMSRHPRLFPPGIRGLLRAGERGGELSTAVRRASEHLEREAALRKRLAASLLYPACIAAVAVVASAFLITFVLPRFAELLSDADVALPTSTQALLSAGTLVSRAAPGAILLGLAVAIGLLIGISPERRQAWVEGLAHVTPFWGTIRVDRAVAGATRTVAALIRSGLPLVDALEVAAEGAGDGTVAIQVKEVARRVREGSPMSDAMGASAGFPYTLVRLVAVGERTGRLPELMEQGAASMEDRIERRITRASTVIEPVLIIGFGAGVGFVAMALLQAVYGLNAGGF